MIFLIDRHHLGHRGGIRTINPDIPPPIHPTFGVSGLLRPPFYIASRSVEL